MTPYNPGRNFGLLFRIRRVFFPTLREHLSKRRQTFNFSRPPKYFSLQKPQPLSGINVSFIPELILQMNGGTSEGYFLRNYFKLSSKSFFSFLQRLLFQMHHRTLTILYFPFFLLQCYVSSSSTINKTYIKLLNMHAYINRDDLLMKFLILVCSTNCY